jgi:hypothetical protein
MKTKTITIDTTKKGYPAMWEDCSSWWLFYFSASQRWIMKLAIGG